MGLVPHQEEQTFQHSTLASCLSGLATDHCKCSLGLAAFGSYFEGLWAENIILGL